MTTETVTIRPEDVAAILAGDYGDCSDEVLQAVLEAILARGDEIEDGLVKSLPVCVHVWDEGSSDTVHCDYGDDYADAARDLWDGADYGDGDYRVTVSWEATDATGNTIDSGSWDETGHVQEPACPEEEDGEHEWTSEFEGGCTENPGVWSTGGTSMVFSARCKHCGMERVEKTTGSQCNPGECDTTTYSEPDPEWVSAHYPD
jgi:hypothetical protein